MLNLVVPKGSLEKETLRLFAEADIPIKRESEREYNARVPDPRIDRVKLLRPQEIAGYVQQGYFDIGITGYDWVCESKADVAEVMDLDYNKQGVGAPVRIVLAVRQDSGVARPEDLRPGTRISTEYPNLTRQFFDSLGTPVEIMVSYGATEAKVPEIADAVVEITETGSTLARHGMKIVATVLESSTKLVANKTSYADRAKRREIDEICTLLAGVIEGRGKVLLKMNVPEEKLEAVISALPTMKAPTISRLFNSGYYSIETVAARTDVNLLLPKLKKRGAEDILELPITKIIK